MPLRGQGHSTLIQDANLYFVTLAELDTWADKSPVKQSGILPYKLKAVINRLDTRSKGSLMLCHDYKGGYTEKPAGLSYTFNFWSYCKTFIYFSHHRVTIPPAGWINAAHRQGTKMLGTLIFEGDGEADCLRLLVGRLPQSITGPARSLGSQTTLPVSPYYARILAELANQRGFDGYLLNFECPLRGGLEQTRALCAWIGLLESELKRSVGGHAEVIWYDSVIIDGQLRWQDRLNSLNLPFFIPSSGFFTNYTWPPHYPSTTAQYFLSLGPLHISQYRPKLMADIYVGVDVWGRGQHGGGGLACYKAVEHIDPEFLGLSVALFGHAWTWETEEDKEGFTWEKWWAHERTFWVGPTDDNQPVTVPGPPPNQPLDDHGPFKPISSFFPRLSPPNPSDLSFFTSFSPGVGKSWYVSGRQVLDTTKGWTDVDKNSSLGDMLWPRPSLTWEHGDPQEPVPKAIPSIHMDDAWIGGNSLRLALAVAGSDAEDAAFRCIWIPIQSLTLTPSKMYTMSLVYKTQMEASSGLDFDIGLSVKAVFGDTNVEVSPVAPKCCDLDGGWSKLTVDVFIPSDTSPSFDLSVVCGLVVGLVSEEPSQPCEFSIYLGSLAVYDSPSTSTLAAQPKLLWADFGKRAPSTRSFCGTLTWGIGEFFDPLISHTINGPEDPQPMWILGPPAPSFLYFNVYVLAQSSAALKPEDATFIGTTGLDGRRERFYVDPACLPTDIDQAQGCRFYIQGITDHGDILPWEHCVFVDVTK